ncbi:hypothetical protein [Auritidibacter ignavus]|uniref:hypothetical protein n=1 Tax=Auritidibacter ignavus TaxID=678932 RepID=UPI0024BB20E7|nr:hypothetical protein [Auritidibacter ignavus]WHS34860.1 hypothetical protein QM403_11250 [Auritidibacter ignavus]
MTDHGHDVLGQLFAASSAGTGAGQTEIEQKCSRRGCQETARWKIVWNNPKIHTPKREKTWLACDAHRQYLEQFLAARTFWKFTRPL